MNDEELLKSNFLQAQSIIEKMHEQFIVVGRPSNAPIGLATYMLSLGDMLDHSNMRLIATLDNNSDTYHVSWGVPAEDGHIDKTIEVVKSEFSVDWLINFIESNLLKIQR